MRLWNPHKGLHIKTYAGHGYDVRDVSCAADNKTFASCGGDRQVFVWDVASGQCTRKLRGHDGVVNAVRPLAHALMTPLMELSIQCHRHA